MHGLCELPLDLLGRCTTFLDIEDVLRFRGSSRGMKGISEEGDLRNASFAACKALLPHLTERSLVSEFLETLLSSSRYRSIVLPALLERHLLRNIERTSNVGTLTCWLRLLASGSSLCSATFRQRLWEEASTCRAALLQVDAERDASSQEERRSWTPQPPDPQTRFHTMRFEIQSHLLAYAASTEELSSLTATTPTTTIPADEEDAAEHAYMQGWVAALAEGRLVDVLQQTLLLQPQEAWIAVPALQLCYFVQGCLRNPRLMTPVHVAHLVEILRHNSEHQLVHLELNAAFKRALLSGLALCPHVSPSDMLWILARCDQLGNRSISLEHDALPNVMAASLFRLHEHGSYLPQLQREDVSGELRFQPDMDLQPQLDILEQLVGNPRLQEDDLLTINRLYQSTQSSPSTHDHHDRMHRWFIFKPLLHHPRAIQLIRHLSTHSSSHSEEMKEDDVVHQMLLACAILRTHADDDLDTLYTHIECARTVFKSLKWNSVWFQVIGMIASKCSDTLDVLQLRLEALEIIDERIPESHNHKRVQALAYFVQAETTTGTHA